MGKGKIEQAADASLDYVVDTARNLSITTLDLVKLIPSGVGTLSEASKKQIEETKEYIRKALIALENHK